MFLFGIAAFTVLTANRASSSEFHLRFVLLQLASPLCSKYLIVCWSFVFNKSFDLQNSFNYIHFQMMGAFTTYSVILIQFDEASSKRL